MGAKHCQASIENTISYQHILHRPPSTQINEFSTNLGHLEHDGQLLWHKTNTEMTSKWTLTLDLCENLVNWIKTWWNQTGLWDYLCVIECGISVEKLSYAQKFLKTIKTSFKKIVKMWLINEMKRGESTKERSIHARRKKKACRKRNFWCSIYKRKDNFQSKPSKLDSFKIEKNGTIIS